MGNVRNPVGPLPSSIYWRRRAVVLCLLAVVLAVVAWVLVPGGGSGGTNGHRTGAHGPGGRPGRTPLPSITPGPTTSQTGITAVPGGRSVGGTGDSASGDPDTGDSATPAATAGGAADAGSRRLSAGTSVPTCHDTHVQLALHSVKNSYEPGEKPKFAVSAANSGGGSCKVDFSAVSAVVTIVNSGNHHVWASDDCPASRSAYLLEVPAKATTTYDVPWNLRVSSPECATPSGTHTASSGTYLAKVAVPGLGSAQTSFVLSDV